jgi:hypothetical protein
MTVHMNAVDVSCIENVVDDSPVGVVDDRPDGVIDDRAACIYLGNSQSGCCRVRVYVL